MLVIRLVEENVFSVISVFSEIKKHSLLIDTVLLSELLPKLLSHLVSTLTALQSYYFFRHLL